MKRALRAFVLASACLGLALPAMADDDAPIEKSGLDHEGFKTLINKPLSGPALKIADLDELWKTWEKPLREKAAEATPEERRKMTFERYGFTPREFDSTGLPLGFVDDGKGNLVTNCFACHGGKVAGRSIPGLPNSHQDLSAVYVDGVKLKAVRAGRDPDTLAVKPPPMLPPNFAKGTSNATMFSIFLGAMRDKDLNKSGKMELHQTLVHNSIDAPPWWHYKKKEKIYCDAFALPHHRTLMQFTMSPDVSGEQIRSWEPEFLKIEAFIRGLEPPKYPFPIDKEMAKKGERVFNETCARCHGTYGADAEFPNKVIPIKEIGTDAVRLGAIAPESTAAYNQTWFAEYGKYPADTVVTGYLAQPLDGIWATAPYLHNGSVPTIEALFAPEAARPKVWKRTEDGYDQKRIGVEAETADRVPDGLNDRERRQYYDTTLASQGNGGHLFPDQELNAEEKLLVMEYLKTL